MVAYLHTPGVEHTGALAWVLDRTFQFVGYCCVCAGLISRHATWCNLNRKICESCCSCWSLAARGIKSVGALFPAVTLARALRDAGGEPASPFDDASPAPDVGMEDDARGAADFEPHAGSADVVVPSASVAAQLLYVGLLLAFGPKQALVADLGAPRDGMNVYGVLDVEFSERGGVLVAKLLPSRGVTCVTLPVCLAGDNFGSICVCDCVRGRIDRLAGLVSAPSSLSSVGEVLAALEAAMPDLMLRCHHSAAVEDLLSRGVGHPRVYTYDVSGLSYNVVAMCGVSAVGARSLGPRPLAPRLLAVRRVDEVRVSFVALHTSAGAPPVRSLICQACRAGRRCAHVAAGLAYLEEVSIFGASGEASLGATGGRVRPVQAVGGVPLFIEDLDPAILTKLQRLSGSITELPDLMYASGTVSCCRLRC